jgi:hypothetical protein
MYSRIYLIGPDTQEGSYEFALQKTFPSNSDGRRQLIPCDPGSNSSGAYAKVIRNVVLPRNERGYFTLSSLEFSPLRLVLFEHGHLALHESIKHRHRECGFAVPLAPNHAFVDELLSDSGNRCCNDAECGSNIPGLVRSWTELRHRSQMFLLQSCQAVETHTEEIRIEMRNDVWCRLFDVDSAEGNSTAFRTVTPDLGPVMFCR